MMARHLALVLAGVFSVSLVSVLMPEPAQAVCRPHCLDLNKKRGEVRDFDRGDRRERGERWERNKQRVHALLQQLHKKLKHGKHRGHGGHDDPTPDPGSGGGGGGDTGGGGRGPLHRLLVHSLTREEGTASGPPSSRAPLPATK